MFDDEPGRTIDGVDLNGAAVDLDELTDWFDQAGLPVRRGATAKAINDASSSAYQDWQRASLGAITVSDVDLLYAPGGGRAVRIFELKRSFKSLASWSPYPDDFANFNLVKDLARRADIGFTIAYNVRHKEPKFFDDASVLALFNYSRSRGASPNGQVSIADFIAGRFAG